MSECASLSPRGIDAHLTEVTQLALNNQATLLATGSAKGTVIRYPGRNTNFSLVFMFLSGSSANFSLVFMFLDFYHHNFAILASNCFFCK